MYENNKDIGWKKKDKASGNGSYDDSLIKGQINVLNNKITNIERITNHFVKTLNELKNLELEDNDVITFEANGSIDFQGETINIDKICTIVGNSCKLMNGTLLYGGNTGRIYETSISDVKFDNCILEIRNVRKLDINCVFANVTKAIFLNPKESDGTHSIAQLNIAGRFRNVDYGIYYDFNDWQKCSDIAVGDVIFNYCNVCPIYMPGGVDGILIEGKNTFFFQPFDTKNARKEQHIVLGQTNWVVINGNNFFESGSESIILTNPKKLIISNNNFAWCGQKKLSDIIKISGITTDVYANIIGNNIEGMSGSFVSIDVPNCQVNLISNMYNAGNFSEMYYGEESLDNAVRYLVNKKRTAGRVICRNNSYSLNCKENETDVTERETVKSYGGNGYTNTVVNFTQTTPSIVCKTYNAQMNTNYFSGLVIVTIKAGATVYTSSNESCYFLLVSKGSVKELGKTGMTEGGSKSHPSFTFTHDATNNELIATPINSTSGDFTFNIQYFGNIVCSSYIK